MKRKFNDASVPYYEWKIRYDKYDKKSRKYIVGHFDQKEYNKLLKEIPINKYF